MMKNKAFDEEIIVRSKVEPSNTSAKFAFYTYILYQFKSYQIWKKNFFFYI